jgi:hypothetical protein
MCEYGSEELKPTEMQGTGYEKAKELRVLSVG